MRLARNAKSLARTVESGQGADRIVGTCGDDSRTHQNPGSLPGNFSGRLPPRPASFLVPAFQCSGQLMRLASKAVSSSGHLFPVVWKLFIARKYQAMCPTDAEYSTFNIRRTLYFKSREERSRNPPQWKNQDGRAAATAIPGSSPGTISSIVNPDESASSTSPG
jgi:hypothetical protein